jgi:hypothetical protein
MKLDLRKPLVVNPVPTAEELVELLEERNLQGEELLPVAELKKASRNQSLMYQQCPPEISLSP